MAFFSHLRPKSTSNKLRLTELIRFQILPYINGSNYSRKTSKVALILSSYHQSGTPSSFLLKCTWDKGKHSHEVNVSLLFRCSDLHLRDVERQTRLYKNGGNISEMSALHLHNIVTSSQAAIQSENKSSDICSNRLNSGKQPIFLQSRVKKLDFQDKLLGQKMPK